MVGLYTIVRREIARFIRIWSQTLLPPIINVTLYFVIFGNLIGSRIGEMGGVSYIEYLVPGLIMMSIITNAPKQIFLLQQQKLSKLWNYKLKLDFVSGAELADAWQIGCDHIGEFRIAACGLLINK